MEYMEWDGEPRAGGYTQAMLDGDTIRWLETEKHNTNRHTKKKSAEGEDR
jgi:hypothetical protein